MSRRDKERRRVLDAERELRDRLLAHLRVVAAGRNTAFFETEERWASPDGIAILAEARRIERLAAQNGEEAPVAAMVIDAFRRAQDKDDHHRLGPIRLAQALLESAADADRDR